MGLPWPNVDAAHLEPIVPRARVGALMLWSRTHAMPVRFAYSIAIGYIGIQSFCNHGPIHWHRITRWRPIRAKSMEIGVW